MRFAAAQCGLTILRYITDHAPHLSLSVLARVVGSDLGVLEDCSGWLGSHLPAFLFARVS